MSAFFEIVTGVLLRWNATIDKFIGDAVMAFWNAPGDVPNHELEAVRAALEITAEVGPLTDAWASADPDAPHVRVRVGLHCGPAVVGNMGSKTRFDYTMLGDAVNLAARLEGINKQFFNYTAISQSTRDLVGDRIECRELGRVTVVGRQEPVTIYEPMTPEAHAQRRDVLEIFDRGLRRFYRGEFEQAAEIFAAIKASDPPAKAYLQRCRDLLAHPPDLWQGIWVVTTK